MSEDMELVARLEVDCAVVIASATATGDGMPQELLLAMNPHCQKCHREQVDHTSPKC